MGALLSHYPLGPLKPFKVVEGCDFQIINNKRFRDDVSFNAHKKNRLFGRKFKTYLIMAMLVVGALLTSLLFKTLSHGIKWLSGMRFDFVRENVAEGNIGGAWFGEYFISLAMALPSCLLVIWQPAAAGGGIPELISQLNGARPDKLLDFYTGVAKSVGLLLSVSSGLAVGYEGPMIHLGALVMYQTLNLFWHLLKRTKLKDAVQQCMNDVDSRNLVVAGSAVGIATAFRSPIGGCLFVIEEAITFFEPNLIFRTYFTCVISYYSLAIFYQGRNMNPADFTEFDLDVTCKSGYKAEDIILFAMLGSLNGLFGAFFNGILTRAMKLRAKYINKFGWKRILDLCAVVFVTATLVVLIPVSWPCTHVSKLAAHIPQFEEQLVRQNGSEIFYLSNNCLNDNVWSFFRTHNISGEDEIEGIEEFFESRELVTAGCPANHYNELRSLLYSTNHNAVNIMFSRGTFEVLSAGALFVYLLVFFFNVIIANSVSVPAGLVIPSIVIGGAVGRLFGVLINAWFKEPLGIPMMDPGTWSIIGAAAFWTGSGRVTMTVAVVMFEITEQFHALPPIAVAVLFARIVGNSINHGIYHSIIHLKGIPFLEDVPSKELKAMSVRDVMKSPVSTVRAVETVANIRLCLNTTHNGFPVVSNDADRPRLLGLILRKHLIAMLPPAVHGDHAQQIKVDVTSEMNETPAVISPEYNLAEAFRMFRTLGLRHLVAVSPSHEVLGIVTRKDFVVDSKSQAYRDAVKKNEAEHQNVQSTAFSFQLQDEPDNMETHEYTIPPTPAREIFHDDGEEDDPLVSP